MQISKQSKFIESLYILIGVLMFSCSGAKNKTMKGRIELRNEDEYWLVNMSKSKTFRCTIKMSSFEEDGDSNFKNEIIRLDPADETFLGKKEKRQDLQLVKYRYELIKQTELNMGSN